MSNTEFRLGVVAVIPFWSQSDNMNTDSNYSYLRSVLPEMVEQTKDTVFLLFWPDPKYGADKWYYKDDGLIDTERVQFVKWPYDTAMLSSIKGFDPARYHEIIDHFGPNIIWLHQVESGAQAYGGYAGSWSLRNLPSIVAQHHYVIHESLPYPTHVGGNYSRLLLQMAGTIASDRVIFNSQHTFNMAYETFTKYLNKDTWGEIEGKSAVLRFGLVDETYPRAPVATKDDVPTFVYNHRMEQYKKPQTTFEIFEDLRREYDLRVWVTQASGQKTGGQSRIHFDAIKFAPSKIDYLNNIAIPAINTLNTTHETFCISILDSMALGHIVVVPDRLTFPEITPPDYPYLFNSVNEQRAMLTSILEHWPDPYNEWREKLQTWAREEFSVSGYATRYLNVFAEVERNVMRSTKAKSTTIDKLSHLFGGMKRGKHYYLRNLQRDIHKIGIGKQAMTELRIVREALDLGIHVGADWQGTYLTK